MTSTAWSQRGRQQAGATLLQGTEVVGVVTDDAVPASPLPALHRRHGQGEGRDEHAGDQRALRGRRRRVELPDRPDVGHDAPARPAAGHGATRLLPVRPARRPLHRVAPGHPRRGWHRGARLRLDLPDGRRAGERRRRTPVDRAALEGRQHQHPLGYVRGLRAQVVGPEPRDEPRSPDGRQAAHGALGRAQGRGTTCSSPATPVVRSTPSMARASPTATRPADWPQPRLATPSPVRVRARWPSTTASSTRHTALTTRWPGPSCI